MNYYLRQFVLVTAAAFAIRPAPAQQPAAPAAPSGPAVKTNVDEVLLDLIVRDKKGKPITDLTPDDLTVLDNGAKQTFTSFRLIRGAEAISPGGATTHLDPLREVRLVTLAFEAMTEPDQRRMSRTAALDLIHGEQGANVYYSVVVINTRLLVLQQFTKDQGALSKAIERATGGLGGPQLASESDAIQAELKRNLGGQMAQGAGATDTNLLAGVNQIAGQTVANGSQALDAKLASVMLDMLRLDAAVASQGTRLSLEALKALVQGLQQMPGRKSVLYFTQGLYVTPELDVPFRNLLSFANRANVTFYSVDTHGVSVASLNAGSTSQLDAAARNSANTTQRLDGGATKDEILAADKAEVAGRANVQLMIRDLAESTGGFLIGDSNDFREPLRRVNEEIASYYELTFNPGIQNYDGSFRKLAVNANRKDLVIHARSGYFALPPDALRSGIQPYELPLLKAISDGKLSEDVPFRAGAVVLQPKGAATDVDVLVELPLHGLQPKPTPGKTTLDVHCSLAALVKNSGGEVVQKLSRDRSFQVTADQLKMGNFLDKLTVELPPGKYALETAIMDRESGKIGFQRSDFTVAPSAKGVAISSLTAMRSYAPNVKGLDPNEPFQFQGGAITPTLDTAVKRTADAMLRLFFVVYQNPAISAKPTVEIEFLQDGKSLTKVPMELPAPDAQGRIPYLMTIPAASIPPGAYEVRATAKQGDTTSQSSTVVKIEPM